MDVKDERSLQRSAIMQAKDCLRKCLQIAKDIYKKFGANDSFIRQFSADLYQQVISDQLESLKTSYISEKSYLVEILCQSWTLNHSTLASFQTYPDLIPALFKILTHPLTNIEVTALLMQLLKTLLDYSLFDPLEDRKVQKTERQKAAMIMKEEEEEDWEESGMVVDLVIEYR